MIKRNPQGHVVYTPELVSYLKQQCSNSQRLDAQKFLREKLRISPRRAREVYRDLILANQKRERNEKELPVQHQASADYHNDLGVAEAVTPNIKTLEELLTACNVDLNVWEVERYVVNKWETARKNKSANIRWVGGKADGYVDDKGGMSSHPLFQVKAWLVRKVPLATEQIVKDLIEDAKNHAPVYKKINYPVDKDGNGIMLEIAPFDLHLGKLADAELVGSNYDSKIAEKLFMDAVVDLTERAKRQYNIIEIVFPIGQDFLHIDNLESETTKGTRQDADSRQTHIYKKGRQLLVKAVEYLQTIAPVKVICVPGNHDRLSMFHLADGLECWFHRNPNVKVDNGHRLRKYHRFGECLIGYTHGSEEAGGAKSLPLVMATESPDWSATKHRAYHIGHFHHKRDFITQESDEERGIRVSILPSLSTNDFWHESRSYKSKRAAEAHLWDAKKGEIAILSYNVD